MHTAKPATTQHPTSPATTATPQRVRCHYASPLGPMTLAASDQGLAGVWFDGQKHMPNTLAWPVHASHPVLQQAVAELQQYFAGARTQFGVALDTNQGTAFQQQVWHALQGIGSGSTMAYGQLAQRIGKPAAVRAVGAAVGRNPISIIIPCHRVVGANGALTGYAGGLERKVALLHREQTGQTTIPA
jgi:methylated-DNA-[protein]-cysteine S-methyltransferase